MALWLAALLAGAPMTPLTTSSAVETRLRAKATGRVTVRGTLERVTMGKGRKTWRGTAIVLDDGAAVWVTYGLPPEGWAPLLGQFVETDGELARAASTDAQSLLAPHLVSPGQPRALPRSLSSLEGRRVELAGVAETSKGGAVLLIDGEPIFVDGLREWPAPLRTRRVALGGTLTRRSLLPVATVNARGEVSQGVAGDSKPWVLEASSAPTALDLESP